MKKYSMLVLGILMLGIFFTSDSGKKFINKYRNNYIPSDCRALVSRTEANLNKQDIEWDFECELEVLSVTAPFDNAGLKDQALKQAMYRDLANKLVLFAKNSNEETLERIETVRFKLVNEKMEILAQTHGDQLSKFKTIREQRNIMLQLQKTVKVKETIK